MNKKFLSVILFSALMVGTAGTFTSCKDYDDDIKDLQGQLDKKASLDDLNAKVATLQTAVDEAKTAANEAKAKAQEALDKAGSSEGGVSEADLAYIIHSGFISGYQNRYGDNLKPPTNVYHRMTA